MRILSRILSPIFGTCRLFARDGAARAVASMAPHWCLQRIGDRAPPRWQSLAIGAAAPRAAAPPRHAQIAGANVFGRLLARRARH